MYSPPGYSFTHGLSSGMSYLRILCQIQSSNDIISIIIIEEGTTVKILVIICAIFILIVPAILGCQQTTPAEAPSSTQKPVITSETYNNTEQGFSVEYPADWDLDTNLSDIEKSKGIVVKFGSPESDEYDRIAVIIIETDKMLRNLTVEEYAKAFEEQILKKNLPDYRVLNKKTTTIGGMPAFIRTFTATSHGLSIKDTQAYLIKGEICYVITYDVTMDAHDRYADCFDLVISTFKFE